MSRNFNSDDPPSRLIEGLGIFINPEGILGCPLASSIFTPEEVLVLTALPQELLFKMADAAENRHDRMTGLLDLAGSPV